MSFIGEEDVDRVTNLIENLKDRSLLQNGENTDSGNVENKVTKFNHASFNSNKSNKSTIIGEVSYRWVIFTCFFLLSFNNGLGWVTISAISENVIKAYDKSSTVVNLFSLSYMLVFPFFFPIAAYIIDNKDVSLGIKSAAILNIIGAIIKLFLNQSFYLSLFGQVLCAIAQPFIISSTGKLSSIWFRADVRTLITSLLGISNILGTIFGVIFNVFFVSNDIITVDIYKNQVFNYLLAEMILCVCFSIPTIFLFKSKPPHAPSVSQNNMKIPSFKESVKMLLGNKNYIYLLITNTIVVGYFNLIGVINNQYLYAYNVNTTQSALIAGVGNITGLVATIILSLVIDKVKKYKPFFFILIIIATITVILMTILLEVIENSGFYLNLIGITLILIASVPLYSIGSDYSCEITYPVGELISVGLILTGSQILGVAESFLADYFLSIKKPFLINTMTIFFFLIALIMIFLLEENLIRNKMEEADIEDNLDYEDTKSNYLKLEKEGGEFKDDKEDLFVK